MFLLVAYDIANDKRLRRVAVIMEDYGARVQRSVFECRINGERLSALMKKIKGVINRREDRVQIYRLCAACRQRFDERGEGRLSTDAEVYIC